MAIIQKKVCLLGASGVGKTSIVRRFVYGFFNDEIRYVDGLQVSRRAIAMSQADGIVTLMMMLWDLTNSPNPDQVLPNYLYDVAGAILVCDLTRPETIEALWTYTDILLTFDPEVPIVLAANKYDLMNNDASPKRWHHASKQLEALTAKLKIPSYVTSAKTDLKIEPTFYHLGQLLVT